MSTKLLLIFNNSQECNKGTFLGPVEFRDKSRCIWKSKQILSGLMENLQQKWIPEQEVSLENQLSYIEKCMNANFCNMLCIETRSCQTVHGNKFNLACLANIISLSKFRQNIGINASGRNF